MHICKYACIFEYYNERIYARFFLINIRLWATSGFFPGVYWYSIAFLVANRSCVKCGICVNLAVDAATRASCCFLSVYDGSTRTVAGRSWVLGFALPASIAILTSFAIFDLLFEVNAA